MLHGFVTSPPTGVKRLHIIRLVLANRLRGKLVRNRECRERRRRPQRQTALGKKTSRVLLGMDDDTGPRRRRGKEGCPDVSREGSRLRGGLSSEGGQEGSVSPWQQDATGVSGAGAVRSRNPPCLPEASLRLTPSGAAPVPAAGGGARPARAAGAGSSRGSRSGGRWRRRLQRGPRSPTWPQRRGPARPVRPVTDPPTGAVRGVVLPATPGAVVHPTAGQCGRGISPLPVSDWLFPCGPRLLLPPARREPMGAARGGARWAMGRWRRAAAAARALRAGTTRSWEPANRAPSTARGGGPAP